MAHSQAHLIEMLEKIIDAGDLGIIDILEKIIDASDLGSIVAALALVCHEKAEHLRINWRDEITAKVWDRAGNKIMRLAEDSSIITVS